MRHRKNVEIIARQPGCTKVIDDTCFNAISPLYSKYFERSNQKLQSAHRGEEIFNRACSSCHGQYAKTWEFDGNTLLGFKNLEVVHPQPTIGVDVGTDRARLVSAEVTTNYIPCDYERIVRTQSEFESLGEYVPPVLTGDWSAWPYLHNGSVPSLDDLLKPSDQRVKKYYIRPPRSKEKDYDKDRVGFSAKIGDPELLNDTNLEGLSKRRP